MYQRKNTKLDTIPDVLITSSDACELLGINRTGVNSRLDKLQFSYASYKGHRIKLFRRADVEALLPTPDPEGYAPLKTIAAEFGYLSGSGHVRRVLERAGVPRLRHICRHPYYIYPVEQSRAALADYCASLPKNRQNDPAPQNDHLDALPDDLVTATEAAQILGLSCPSSRGRLGSLQSIPVVVSKHYRRAYRRAEVEALKYSPVPEGYLTRFDLMTEFGYGSHSSAGSLLHKILLRHNVPFLLHPAPRPLYCYPADQARAALTLHKKSNRSRAAFASQKTLAQLTDLEAELKSAALI